ncbi:MAG: hypothetical protein R3A13_10310 [Bdellovibrionota bacterium]
MGQEIKQHAEQGEGLRVPEVVNLDQAPELGIRRSKIEALKVRLPEDHQPYADKYFLRTAEILKREGLNPIVRAQVFIRKGPGTIHGIEEAIAIIDKYSDFLKTEGKLVP